MPANVVFTGNFLYPVGMAGTKRVQHDVEAARRQPGWRVCILLLRQNHPGRDLARLSGTHAGVEYCTIGADLMAGFRLPLAMIRYVADGFRFLARRRSAGALNVLVIYAEPNLENLPILLAARSLGYRVVIDVVEDFYWTGEGASLLPRLKSWSGRLLARRVERLADAVLTLSAYLRTKFETLTRGRVPVYLVPLSVDPERFAAPAPPTGPVRGIVYAGSFGAKDGVENLIEAFEAVADRHSALVVPPGSVPAIAAALEYVLAHPLESAAIGREGRRIAEARFDARTNGEQLVCAIEALGAGAD